MYDLILRGGTLYGADRDPEVADLAVTGDRVAAVGPLDQTDAARTLDVSGLVVAPGFINILSHSYFSIWNDPRSLSELHQGVTTQVFGEGDTMGPLTADMSRRLERDNAELDLQVTWGRLSDFLTLLEQRGTAQNVASFVGNGTLRPFVVGYDDRPVTAAELDQMRGLLAEEMADGALGLSTALIYPPESYASTQELVALCRVVADSGGMYISHIRDESAGLEQAVEELLCISAEAEVPAEIYHLKASGRANWPALPRVLDRIDAARQQGRAVTADVYPYTASGTGLTTLIPDEFHEGGPDALYDRLADPASRTAIRAAMGEGDRWEGGKRPEDVLILSTRKARNRRFQGRTLAQVAELEGVDPLDAALELIADDRSRVGTAFFTMSEDNLREELCRPWVGVCSDAASISPAGPLGSTPTHPRGYGSFARVLGRYVRDEHVLDLADAIDRMTVKPASALGLTDRGRLTPGSYADIVAFDAVKVADTATFTEPHRFAVGISAVVVNGQVAVQDGQSTGVLAGRALRRGSSR